jgi:ABC-type dipeptide/oligopeptide/nickel transport system permease component
MVLGICGVVFAFCYWPIGLVCGIIGVVLGGVALSKMNSGGDRSGRGMAIAGLVCSIIALGVSVLALIFVGSVIAAMNSSSY